MNYFLKCFIAIASVTVAPYIVSFIIWLISKDLILMDILTSELVVGATIFNIVISIFISLVLSFTRGTDDDTI